ncbi:heme o synthase [Flavobacteriaceae bacterium]|nr:heme o synthase [Flavobacteriaceae bacterium]MDA9372491.1 heme o synthase [Flavobacteriaceae bacterium]MDB4115197.1 heme o synthase [Flavobacteriaceae bacterium]MDC0097740.1 heme o synthase [Flavobacteriaceae bacterium]MDC0342010.1 heme o synthase [Flavobacteriaceae bacterium]
MSVTQTQVLPTSWVKNFTEITKLRLSVSVVFSSVAGYLLGAAEVDFMILLLLCIGGYCMVGASNVYNQIMERDLDSLMDRTKNRPIPAGRMSIAAALSIAVILTIVGISVLYSINPQTAMFGAISIFIYVFLYTPLKTKTPLSVFVGAFPGAIPFMLGWVAATNDFGIEPGTLFMIQFFWQFPHFWAIGWFLFDDYKKGGFFMLPTGKRDRTTAVQVVFYSVCTVLSSLIPAFGVTGAFYITPISAVIIGGLGIWFVYYGLRLYKQKTDKSAKQLMLVSVSYITLLQIIYVADKFIR